jgi:hypothetical protein
LFVEDGTRLFIEPGIVKKLRDRKVDLAVRNNWMYAWFASIRPVLMDNALIRSLTLRKCEKNCKIPVVDLGPKNV